ncbi:MAG: SDR family NAD(P)-dependent oxidoreductase, partial [Stackebrandtia sp.]
MSDSPLGGKSCVITGAASGIGKACARLFIRRGARVIATDTNAEGLESLRAELADAGDITVVAGDVSKPDDARDMIAAAVTAYGGLDILVANAGILPLGDILESTVDDWDRVMSADGRGMFLTCKYAVEQLRSQGRGGSIVCLSSISGLAGQSRQSTYGPAKFVASGITMHLAVEQASHGIRVNAVAPGTIRTERVRALDDEPGGPEYLESMSAAHPLGRLGVPEEVATAVAFLAGDDA